MSAATTAAGYLYASGRLHWRAAREQEKAQEKPATRQKIRVAVYPAEERPKQRRAPKIEYRTRRRWSAE